MKANSFIAPDFWFKRNACSYALLPFSWVYTGIVMLRRFLYQCGIMKSKKFGVPTIVVGNITVGGAGKTPFVIWLAKFLQENGYKVGIISRGYGGAAKQYPMIVTKQSNFSEVGDEALVIMNNVDCPMIVAPRRVDAAAKLLEICKCDAIISDDGLQHYALGRDLEVVMVDGEREFGNKFCLPAGPLREPLPRLRSANFIIKNFTIVTLDVEGMCLVPECLVNVKNPQITKNINEFKNLHDTRIFAIAGIGNSARFFKTLKLAGLHFTEKTFPDHFSYTKDNLIFKDKTVTIMTEKDAVKCRNLVDDNFWFLRAKTEVSNGLQRELLTEITKLMRRL